MSELTKVYKKFDDYKNLTEREKNELTLQFEPLLNKITHQFTSKLPVEWGVVKSMAYEGFAIALQKYDPNRSKMNFMQFAGFAIRNNILTCLDNELRVVKLSHYAQKKATDRGDSLFNSVSLTGSIFGETDSDRGTKALRASEKAKFADGDVYTYLYSRIEAEFSARDCEFFYKIFGLKNYDETKGKDVAQEYGVSEGLVSQKIKKIILFIKKDNDLCEMLANLAA